jgi:hypothetical protein
VPDVILRVALAIEVGIAGVQYAAVFAPHAVSSSRGRRLLVAQIVSFVGGLIAILYVFAGQFKALLLGIPFDAFSWVGVVGFTLGDIGTALVLWDRHRRGRS